MKDDHSKSLQQFRFAFRTAIMKKIDIMERLLEGQVVVKRKFEKRKSHATRVDQLRYVKFNYAVRAAFN